MCAAVRIVLKHVTNNLARWHASWFGNTVGAMLCQWGLPLFVAGEGFRYIAGATGASQNAINAVNWAAPCMQPGSPTRIRRTDGTNAMSARMLCIHVHGCVNTGTNKQHRRRGCTATMSAQSAPTPIARGHDHPPCAKQRRRGRTNAHAPGTHRSSTRGANSMVTRETMMKTATTQTTQGNSQMER